MNIKKTNASLIFSIILTLSFHLPCYAESFSNDTPETVFHNSKEQINLEENISSPQNADTPFAIKIVANNNSNTRVHLHSALGHITPSYIDLKNGEWTGEISISEPGKRNQIEMHWLDKSNKPKITVTNTFDLTDHTGTIPTDAILSGKITNNNIPSKGTVVTITANDDNQTIFSQKTNDDGEYTFENLYPGIYKLKIEKPNHHTIAKKIRLNSKRKITENIKLAYISSTNKKTPLLLVPGIMGSYSTERPYWVWPYPTLPPTPPAWDSGELAPLDPFGQVGWNKLVKTFENLGYTEGTDLFVVPYDWSLSIPDISYRYLTPWIQHAKQISGRDKVDIIAHSMGGLVTRTYIQSDGNEKSVRKFAMLGTPNKGATSVYYIWESGDPITPDTAYGTPAIWDPTAYFYSNVLEYFYQERLHGYACKFGIARRYKPLHCDINKIYTGSHNNVLSTGQLLPIFNDALFKSGMQHKASPLIKEENTFLKALNNVPCINPKGCIDTSGELYNFTNPQFIFTPDSSGIETLLLRGTNNEMIKSLLIIPRPDDYTGDINKDGIPQYTILSNDGDGTVLTKSVDINEYLDANLEIKEKDGVHASLMADFLHELAEFITGSAVPNHMIAEPERENFAISIKGRVQINTNSITINGAPFNQDNILEKNHKTHSSGLTLKTTDSGVYTISLSSPYEESFDLSISYFDNHHKRLFMQKYLGYYDSSLTKFDFEFDNKNSDNPINHGRVFQTPSDLSASNNSDRVFLSWQDQTADNNNDVAYYEIFWKKNSEHTFRLLDKTKTNDKNYLTNHPWEDRKTNVYAVRAILSDDKATFLSPPEFYIAPENIVSHQ